MFPLLINTIPENGSENVGLDQQISIEFNGDLSTDLTSASIRLINMNLGEEVEGIAPSVNISNNSILDVVVPANATGGHLYEGLTQYKLLVSSLSSSVGETLDGELELRFTTKENEYEDYVEPHEPVSTAFSVIRSYPQEGSVVTPDVIRLKFSEAMNLSSDLSSILLIKGDNIDDALFMGETNLLVVEDITVDSDLMTIQCPELEPAKKYSLSISNIQNAGGEDIEPYNIVFTSSFASMYVQVQDILSSKAVSILLEGSTEMFIAEIISNNSNLAEFIATDSGNEEIDWENPPFYVLEYVKYKTQYDVIFDKFIELSGNPTSKKLKDLQIEYGYSLSDLLKMADRLELRFKYWEDYLRGSRRGKALPAAFRKGESIDEMPEFMDRMFTDIEGNKEW